MKRIITSLAVTLGLVGGLAAIPAVSQAFPSSPANCNLADSFYGIGNGNWQGDAHLSCALPTNALVQGCLQDYTNNQWTNYSCQTYGPAYDSGIHVYRTVNPYQYSYRGWRMWGYTRVSCSAGWCSTSNASGYKNL